MDIESIRAREMSQKETHKTRERVWGKLPAMEAEGGLGKERGSVYWGHWWWRMCTGGGMGV